MPTPDDFRQLDHVASPIFVIEASPTSEPIYVFLNLCGRTLADRPLSDFVGRTALDIYPAAFGRSAYERHCAVIASRTAMIYEIELPLGGQNRTIRTTLTPELDNAGNVRLIYGNSIDVSVEREALEAQVSFDTVTSEMEQFIAMAAHDLRAPMRNVSLLAEMLRDDFVDHGDGKLEVIDMLEDVAAKSMSLITDVLAHARATAPKNPQTTFDFSVLCREICDVLDPQEHHVFNVNPVRITVDRTALQIALRNIIDNAIKHSQRSLLELDINVTGDDNGMLEVTLHDNGAGFDNSALVFLNGGTFRMDSGYGLLGVRRMINARGGRITARNGQRGGGIVQFTLPGFASADTLQGETADVSTADVQRSA